MRTRLMRPAGGGSAATDAALCVSRSRRPRASICSAVNGIAERPARATSSPEAACSVHGRAASPPSSRAMSPAAGSPGAIASSAAAASR